jgi:hypothetical protein
MPSIQQDILRDDSNDKQSLISESVMTIQISVHPAGEEPDQHIIRVAPWVSRTTTVREVPTKSKSELCSRDEVHIGNAMLCSQNMG